MPYQPRTQNQYKPKSSGGLRYNCNGPKEAEEMTSEESTDESDERSAKMYRRLGSHER